MAYSDKDIVITPNKGSSTDDPKINFTGGSASGVSTISVNVYDVDNGTLSFDGTAGQLFSITNNLTSGSIFSVNDVSGFPSIDVNADGTIQLAPLGSTEYVGIGTTNPTQKLDINGNLRLRGAVYDNNNVDGTSGQILVSTGSGVVWADAGTTVGISTNADLLDGLDSTQFLRSDVADTKVGVTTFQDDIFLGGNIIPSDTNIKLGDATVGQSITTGTCNFLAGQNAGCCLTNGKCNVFLGRFAGQCNISGDTNVFIGDGAGAESCGGTGNFAGGYCAGHKITNGFANVFLGGSSGYNSTGGFNNIFGGYASGYCNTDGSCNVFLGYGAGYRNETEGAIVAVGWWAGYQNQTGCNVFVGARAGCGNTSGSSVVFIGNQAGYCNTTQSGSVAIGATAGRANRGNDNIYLGREAGWNSTRGTSFVTGTNNFFAGVGAGGSTTNGSNNVFLGPKVGYNNLSGGSNNFIGNYTGYCNTTGFSNNFIGDFVGYSNISGKNNNFFGTNAGTNNTSGSCNIFLGCNAGANNTEGCNNVFLGSTAGGCCNTTQSNSIAIGNCAGRSNAANDNIYLGREAGWNATRGATTVTGTNNFFAGVGAGGSTTTGNDNVFIGNNAGFSNQSGSYNVFIGDNAGFSNQTGEDNIFIGERAGYTHDIGVYNIFFGKRAGEFFTTGSSNTFVGAIAGQRADGSKNSFIGYYAGYDSSGDGNTFVGDYAGYDNIGDNNSALGSSAGFNFVGNNNIALGVGAAVGTITGNNNIYLGAYNGNSTSASNKIIIGSGNASSRLFDSPDAVSDIKFAVGVRTDANPSKYWLVGDENFNIGIGTYIPSGAADPNNTKILNAGIVTANFYYGGGSNLTGVSTFQDDVNIGVGGTTAFFDVSTGRIGLGTNNPQANLHISSGDNGDCTLLLSADASNSNENNNPEILLQQDGGDIKAGIGLGLNDSSDNNSLIIAFSGTGSVASKGIVFKTASTDDYRDAVSRMMIDRDGDVAISTDTNLTARLTVGPIQKTGPSDNGAAAFKTLPTSSGNVAESAIYIEEQNGIEGWYLKVNSDGDLVFNDSASVDRITFQDNGGVGIGTNIPSGAADPNNTTILNTGIVTANFYYGDGSNLTGVAAAGGGGGDGADFNTGLSTTKYHSAANDIDGATAIGVSFPSTAGKTYVVPSIHITNVSTGDLYITSRIDYSGGENVPITNKVLIPYQGALEIIDESLITNPSDHLRFAAYAGIATNAAGVSNGLDCFISYEEKDDTNYIGTGSTIVDTIGGVGYAQTVFTSTTNPSVINTIVLTNYSDVSDVDVSVSIYRNGTIQQGYLAYNLTVPQNSSVQILPRSKRLNASDTIVVNASAANIVGVNIAGKYIV